MAFPPAKPSREQLKEAGGQPLPIGIITDGQIIRRSGISLVGGGRIGNFVLVAGTKTVLDSSVTANTIVLLTRKTSGGTIGTAITYTTSPGSSFTVNSDNILDTSTFSYLLVEP